jgi:hypothetical protein
MGCGMSHEVRRFNVSIPLVKTYHIRRKFRFNDDSPRFTRYDWSKKHDSKIDYMFDIVNQGKKCCKLIELYKDKNKIYDMRYGEFQCVTCSDKKYNGFTIY